MGESLSARLDPTPRSGDQLPGRFNPRSFHLAGLTTAAVIALDRSDAKNTAVSATSARLGSLLQGHAFQECAEFGVAGVPAR